MQWDQRWFDPDAVIDTRSAGWGIVGVRSMQGTEKLRDKYGNILGEIRIDGSSRHCGINISIRLARMTRTTTGRGTSTETP